MTAITIPSAVCAVKLGDAVVRVHVNSIRAETPDEVFADDLAIGLRMGPVTIYASVEHAEALAHALLSMASHIRDAATVQVAQS